jgi:hypothetical protein
MPDSCGRRRLTLFRWMTSPRHSALGYLSPADYEDPWHRQRLTPAA